MFAGLLLHSGIAEHFRTPYSVEKAIVGDFAIAGLAECSKRK